MDKSWLACFGSSAHLVTAEETAHTNNRWSLEICPLCHLLAEVHKGLRCAKKPIYFHFINNITHWKRSASQPHTVGRIQKLKYYKLNITINKLFHQSSAHVLLHRCGLCFLREAVDCDGDVCVFEDLSQYLRHSCPRQSIQATTNTVGKRERKNILFSCSSNRTGADLVTFQMNSLSEWVFLSWTWYH